MLHVSPLAKLTAAKELVTTVGPTPPSVATASAEPPPASAPFFRSAKVMMPPAAPASRVVYARLSILKGFTTGMSTGEVNAVPGLNPTVRYLVVVVAVLVLAPHQIMRARAAAWIPMFGVVPPVEVIGAVAPTLATAAPLVRLSSLFLSAALSDPAASVVAAVIEIAGVGPPEDTIGATPLTETTVAPAPIPASLLKSAIDMVPAVEPEAGRIESVMSAASVAEAPPLTRRGLVPFITRVRGTAPPGTPTNINLDRGGRVLVSGSSTIESSAGSSIARRPGYGVPSKARKRRYPVDS